jgi:hypothetical protein
MGPVISSLSEKVLCLSHVDCFSTRYREGDDPGRILLYERRSGKDCSLPYVAYPTFFCSAAQTHFLFVRVGKSRRGFFHGAHSDPASTRFPQDTRSSRGLDETALALSRDGPNSCSHGGLASHASGRAVVSSAAKLPRHRKKSSVSFAIVRLQEEARC